MKTNLDLELDMLVENLADTLVQQGITAADVNKATVRLINSQRVLSEQDKPGFFARAGDFLKGLTARAGITHATSPGQLEQQKKAMIAAVKNYMGSLSNAGITNAVKLFTPVLRTVNTFHQQALQTKAFGGPGKAGTPAAPGTPPAPGAPGAPGAPPPAGGTPPAPAGGTPPAPAGGTPPPPAGAAAPHISETMPKAQLDTVKGAVYGPSNDGQQGDFSKFTNPEVAKQYFLYNKEKLADDRKFRQFMKNYGYKESVSQKNPYSFHKFLESR